MKTASINQGMAIYLTGLCLLTLCGACLLGIPAYGAVSVKVVDLRCEYLAQPLGLDVAKPRLSWRLEAMDPRARGQRQTSFQILVASSQVLLDQDQGDRWDSGSVQSGESVNLKCAGKPLESGQACFWKVRVADEQGVLSAWSEPARWTMGLMKATDWKAKWIGTDRVFVKGKGYPPPDNTMPDPWFRKTFDLAAAPAEAVAYVASVGYHELYVNGQKASDVVLEPCATDLSHRARYVTYDIDEPDARLAHSHRLPPRVPVRMRPALAQPHL